MLRIIAIGKKHEPWVVDGLKRYQDRLRAPWDVKWELLPHSIHEGQKARQEESQRILRHLDASDFVILLDERGRLLDSPHLSRLLESHFVHSKPITVVIGGAYGVSDELQTRADFIWSLSPLVFPHQLVRLLLVEQLYRAQEIAGGRSYHHD